jgi:DNA-binding transcriptional ArsR family regulator
MPLPLRQAPASPPATPADRAMPATTATMDEATAVVALAALAQGMRLRVFRALVGAGPVGLTPGALAATLDVPASTLSFHLKELMHAGLVSQERDGRHLIYRPALVQMQALLAYLSAHCCQASGGAGCETTSATDCSHC